MSVSSTKRPKRAVSAVIATRTFGERPERKLVSITVRPTVSVPVGEVLTSLQLVFNNLSHTQPDNIDAMLIAPDGTHIYLMSDCGGDASRSVRISTNTTPDSRPLVTHIFEPLRT